MILLLKETFLAWKNCFSVKIILEVNMFISTGVAHVL